MRRDGACSDCRGAVISIRVLFLNRSGRAVSLRSGGGGLRNFFGPSRKCGGVEGDQLGVVENLQTQVLDLNLMRIAGVQLDREKPFKGATPRLS